MNESLQKNGSEAAFLKRGQRTKKRGPNPPFFVVNARCSPTPQSSAIVAQAKRSLA